MIHCSIQRLLYTLYKCQFIYICVFFYVAMSVSGQKDGRVWVARRDGWMNMELTCFEAARGGWLCSVGRLLEKKNLRADDAASRLHPLSKSPKAKVEPLSHPPLSFFLSLSRRRSVRLYRYTILTLSV